jgi:hypothetical protein
MLRVRCKQEFGFQDSIHSSLLESYRRVGSALPPNLGFQVSKTWFTLEASALLAFFFLIGFQVSLVSQDSTVLLRVCTQKSALFSDLRTSWRVRLLRKVGSHRRIWKFARLQRTARKDSIASQSRFSIQESTLLSALRVACKKSVLHKSEVCDRFWKVARLLRKESKETYVCFVFFEYFVSTNREPNTRPPNLLIAAWNLSQGSETQAPSYSRLRNGGGCTLAVGPTRFFPDLFGLRGSTLCRSANLNSSVVLKCSSAFFESSEREFGLQGSIFSFFSEAYLN